MLKIFSEMTCTMLRAWITIKPNRKSICGKPRCPLFQRGVFSTDLSRFSHGAPSSSTSVLMRRTMMPAVKSPRELFHWHLPSKPLP